MNRREHARMVRRDLARAGCTCRPTVTPLPQGTPAPVAGARLGAYVAHAAGCPLGDLFLAANRAGRLPAVLSTRGCGR